MLRPKPGSIITMTSTPRQRYTDAACSLPAVNLKTSALKGVVASVAAETSRNVNLNWPRRDPKLAQRTSPTRASPLPHETRAAGHTRRARTPCRSLRPERRPFNAKRSGSRRRRSAASVTSHHRAVPLQIGRWDNAIVWRHLHTRHGPSPTRGAVAPEPEGFS